jgi:hypothetical protein
MIFTNECIAMRRIVSKEKFIDNKQETQSVQTAVRSRIMSDFSPPLSQTNCPDSVPGSVKSIQMRSLRLA